MKRKILLIAVLVLAMALCITSCSDEPKPTGIQVIDETVKTEYTVGDTPDFSSVKVLVTFDDGTSAVVTADELTFELDTSTAGTKDLVIKYGDFTAKVSVTVKEKVTLTSVKIVPGTVKTEIDVGDFLDLTNIQVEATYSDSTVKVINAPDLTVSEIDVTTVGEKTLTVTYGGMSDSVTIKVAGVESLTIVADTLAKEIFLGERYDTSKLQLIATKTYGDPVTVSAADVTVTQLDTSTVGMKKITITYKGKSIDFDVNVYGITGIVVTPGSIPTKVRVGSALDVSQVTAIVKYSNNTEKSLKTTDLSVRNIDTSTAGKKQVLVSYESFQYPVEVTVVGVSSITVISGSVKNEMLVGETLDTSGLRANVVYTDTTSEVLDASAFTLGSVDSSTAGVKSLSIRYLDKTVGYEVKVCGVVEIDVEGVPRTVVAGESLDLSDMKVYVVYGDTARTRVLVTEGYTTNAGDLDFDVEGAKNLVVSYTGVYGSFNKTVVVDTDPPVLESIEVLTYTNKVGIGQAYDKSNITVRATFGNGAVENIANANLTISEISTAAAGNQTLTVSYTDADSNTTKSTEVTVKVLPVTNMEISGLADLVDLGTAYVTDNVLVTVTFSDGPDTLTAELGVANGVTVTSLDVNTMGPSSVTVSYCGFTKDYGVHVKGVASIRILDGSFESTVRYGYSVDTKNLEIEITYSNETKETKTASQLGTELTVSCNTAVEGFATSLVATYKGVSSEAKTVNVLRIKEISALNGTIPSSINVNTQLPMSVIKLTVVYVDASNAEHTYMIGTEDSNLLLSEFDSSKPGEKALVFSFMGHETTVRIMVNAISAITVNPGTLQDKLNVGQELDTSEIVLKVQYTDGSYIYINTTNIDLSISKIDTSTEGTKILTITYQNFVLDVEIEVVEVTLGTGAIIGIELPDTIVSRDSYKTAFKDQTQAYVVGDDNPYYFYANVTVLNKELELVDVDGMSRASAVQVFLLGGDTRTELTGDALTAMVAVNAANNSYDFTEAAIGKSFVLSIKPAENYDGDPIEHTVTVVDAYNIYDEKELNIVTNSDEDLNGGDIEGHLSQLVAVNNFLAEHEITRPENLAGIVLHCNMSVTLDDIPSEYLYTGHGKAEFYDHVSVFNHEATAAVPNFTMYGNYYSIYSYELPCIVPNGVANNDDEFSSSELFRFRASADLYWAGFDANNPKINHNESNYHANVVNMAFRDNDPNSNDQSASERHMRGLIGLKCQGITLNVTNSNLEAYYITITIDADNTDLKLDQAKLYNAWQGHIFIWNKNHIQETLGGGKTAYNYVFEGYDNVSVDIKDSLVAKCGGPVILSQNADGEYALNAKSGADINVDDASVLYSYVTGQEAWFVAVGHVQTATGIVVMDTFVNGTATAMGQSASFTSEEKIAGVKTINMIMVNMGTGANIGGNEDYNGSFTKNGVTALQMHDGKNPMLDSYLTATGGEAPIFQSSAGGTAFTYADERGCLGIETGAPASPTVSFFQGDYITLYFMGMGILLEYYHG